MRCEYEEYEIFEEGDRVRINDDSYYHGELGTIMEDQIDEDIYIRIKLDGGKENFRWSEDLILEVK